MKVDLNLITSINTFLLQDIKVDFTFLHTVNLKNMHIRLKKRKNLNRYDNFDNKFYRKVQSGFLEIASKNKKKYLKINSDLEISVNKKIIINKIDKLI